MVPAFLRLFFWLIHLRHWMERRYASRPSKFGLASGSDVEHFIAPLFHIVMIPNSQIEKMLAWICENMFPINFDYLYSVDDVWVEALQKMNWYSSMIYRKSESYEGMGWARSCGRLHADNIGWKTKMIFTPLSAFFVGRQSTNSIFTISTLFSESSDSRSDFSLITASEGIEMSLK